MQPSQATPGIKPALFAALCLLAAGCAHVPSDSLQQQRPFQQRLFIALDGIPYDLVEELRREGHFQEFQPPSKVISTFPSTTATGFGGIFRPIGADRPPGYDREYYSYEKKSVQGFMTNIRPQGPNDFRNLFDYYRMTPFQKFWIYAAPGMSGRRDLEKTRRLIWKRPAQRNYMIYIGGTDGGSHILGRKRVKRWLIFMDRFLQKLRRQYEEKFQGDLQIVLLSDHGFHYIRRPNAVSKMKFVHALRKIGMNLSNNLRRPHRVVAIEWGNISGACVYAEEKYVPGIAGILAGIKGIDIVAYHSDLDIYLLSHEKGGEQRAKVNCDKERHRCRYEALVGDPLNYEPVRAFLRKRGKLDPRGFAPSEDWFQATTDHRYPDALFRLHDAFFSLVKNPAPILFSTKPDYEYGDVLTRVGAWFHGGLKGTHGGLFQEASNAFLMTTDPQIHLPATMRYNQVMGYFFKDGRER